MNVVRRQFVALGTGMAIAAAITGCGVAYGEPL
jgi:hypothetical protein